MRPMLVTHEMIGRMLLAVLVPMNAEEALAQELPHGTVAEITPHEGLLVWQVSEPA